LGINGTGFLQARCPSCHPTNSIKALKETQSIETKHGKSGGGVVKIILMMQMPR